MEIKIRGITTPLLFLLKINFSSRILLTGMLLSLLWFFIYYNAREYFFHPFYFILPSLLIVLILVALPSLLRRGVANNQIDNYSDNSSRSSALLEGIDASNMQIEEVKLSQQGSDSTVEGNTVTSNEGVVESSLKSVTIDESMIQQMVDEKITFITSSVGEAVQKASDAINIVNTVKIDIENLKKNMKDLTEAFETTLVDFKAFQAEIANPLNFMRKYFDQLNIDLLSDPTLPLQRSDINVGNGNGKHGNDKITDRNTNNTNNNSNEQIHIKKQEEKEEDIVTIRSKDSNITDTSIKETSRDDEIVPSKGILSLAYANGITLAMLMELILTIGEFMKRFGNEYANILYMQCKLLNLSSEAEKIVYSIVDMLGKSTLTPEECAISLYMLADVLDIKDKDADTLYARLRMSIKSSQIDSKGMGVDEHEHR